MTKSETKRVSLSNNKSGTKKETAKPRPQPLDPFVYVDEVPVTTYASPIKNDPFFTEKKAKKAIKLEGKILRHCYDFNTPCKGSAIERRAIGACEEELFDTYMSKTMPAHLYKRKEEYTPYSGRDGDGSTTSITYEFCYPHLPSFGNSDWTKYYNTIDMADVAEELAHLGGNIPDYFVQSEYRSIVKKLVVTLDTATEVYYVRLLSWVQKKCASKTSPCGFAWINSF